jgi:hypothetical protein
MNESNELSPRISLAEVAARGYLPGRARPFLLAALATLSSAAADWLARYRANRRTQAAQYAMRHLSDHLLRDLGYERRGTTSTAANIISESGCSRDRFAQAYFDFLR